MKLRLSIRRSRRQHRSCRRKNSSEALAPSLWRRQAGASHAATDALLRTVRREATFAGPASAAKVIGIDGFAMRRGHRCGSIVVDLERRKVIDILPDL